VPPARSKEEQDSGFFSTLTGWFSSSDPRPEPAKVESASAPPSNVVSEHPDDQATVSADGITLQNTPRVSNAEHSQLEVEESNTKGKRLWGKLRRAFKTQQAVSAFAGPPMNVANEAGGESLQKKKSVLSMEKLKRVYKFTSKRVAQDQAQAPSSFSKIALCPEVTNFRLVALEDEPSPALIQSTGDLLMKAGVNAVAANKWANAAHISKWPAHLQNTHYLDGGGVGTAVTVKRKSNPQRDLIITETLTRCSGKFLGTAKEKSRGLTSIPYDVILLCPEDQAKTSLHEPIILLLRQGVLPNFEMAAGGGAAMVVTARKRDTTEAQDEADCLNTARTNVSSPPTQGMVGGVSCCVLSELVVRHRLGWTGHSPCRRCHRHKEALRSTHRCLRHTGCG